ncbi:MAG: zf-HC2 domain-containing protein [Lachnospiraceae bacterium]|nr:zf-HC2 domain-containing protein [Lachnospiraceae bacterium]
MNCDTIQDLMILYIDDCCSKESKRIIKEHVCNCESCKKIFDEVTISSDSASASDRTISETADILPVSLQKYQHINHWRASVLQSVLLYFSFALIILGVTLEVSANSVISNGLWAFSIIVPATGFMLSLANWYFIRIYKSRNSFSFCSLLTTICFTALGYMWAFYHYTFSFYDLIQDSHHKSALIVGILFMILLCLLSKLLSNRYAHLLGKES